MKKTDQKKKRIAIRMPNWIGDALIATPVLHLARKLLNDEIYLIVRHQVKDVFLHNPVYDHLIIIDDKRSLFKTVQMLRSYEFDVYINLPESFSSQLIAFLSKASIRIGYNGETFGLLLNNSVEPLPKPGHRSLSYLHLLFYYLTKVDKKFSDTNLGQFKKNLKTEIILTKDEIKKAKAILKKYNLRSKIIGINPNCSAITRRWPQKYFAELADYLINLKNVSVIFFGSNNEKRYVQTIIKLMKQKPIDLSGKISLREYMAVLKIIRLFVTNDSGPMHIANAVGTDVIALEGPADTDETGMMNKKAKRIYISKDLPCSPCVKNDCYYDSQCMKAISVHEVLNIIKKNV